MGRMSSPGTFAGHRRATVTGLVLAGGMARRMGGADKGLVLLAGRPMVEHVVDALRPQVGTILLSANRSHDRYAALGYPVIADALDGYQGPLAGVATALRQLTTEFLVTVPCDAPLLPADLVRRLLAACDASDADVVVASDGERQQPVFLLARTRVAPALEAFLDGGGRRVDDWLSRVRAAVADFSDEPGGFANVNDADERQRIEAQLLSTAGSR